MAEANANPPSGLREEDVRFYERELASFVPARVFDAHCHLWHERHAKIEVPGVPPSVGYDEYVRLIDQIHPAPAPGGRRVGALFIPIFFEPDKIGDANAFVAEEVRRGPDCRGLFFVKPSDDPEWVRQEVRRLGLHGLKCYHTHAAVSPTWEADIPDYLPEPLVRVAHEEGWVITLHMVKARAAADPSNQHWIRRYCERYPDMRLILAHSARGFQPAHNLEGLPKLAGLDNLWFDTSANCEPMAHQAILRTFGPKRLMYGSDFMVSHFRGRSLGAGDSFLWLYEHTPVWGEKHLRVKPVLIGLEHLRSVKWACWSERLSDSHVEDVFWNNAAECLRIQQHAGAVRPTATR